ncbi:MAG: F0F1 ATP synthase subunit epsilon [Acidobacteria bacterium]|nr:F0F1 ATP synthase subunit epsilon [Acidobacteriota bacterium]
MPVLPDQITLEIVTPERLLFSGAVDEVSVPGVEGYLGILPGHAPLLSELKIGEVMYRQEDTRTYLFCSWGFLEVLPDRVSVLAEIAERAEDIDVTRAQAARERAEKRLKSKDPETDFQRARTALERALARLQVASKASPRGLAAGEG